MTQIQTQLPNCDSGSEHKVPVVPTQYHEMTSHHDSNHHYNNLVMEQHHKQELPDTGYDVANNGTLFGGILAKIRIITFSRKQT